MFQITNYMDLLICFKPLIIWIPYYVFIYHYNYRIGLTPTVFTKLVGYVVLMSWSDMKNEVVSILKKLKRYISN
jgi:hypothetical protein